MGSTWKKFRLMRFLARRIGRRGFNQGLRGIRERSVSRVAMDLARVLPPDARSILDVGAQAGLVDDRVHEGSPLWRELQEFLISRGFYRRGLDGVAGPGLLIQWADALHANARLAAA